MAAVVVRFGMAFCGFALVMLVLCSSVSGHSALGNGSITPTMQANQSTPTAHGNRSTATPTAPGNRSTATPTTHHGNQSTPTPTTPGNQSTATPTTHHGNQSTPTPTSHGNHSTAATTTNKEPTPTPEAHGGDHSDRGKWVATGFAVFFLITTIVMTVLYCRQRKIYRELEGDSSLSRLI